MKKTMAVLLAVSMLMASSLTALAQNNDALLDVQTTFSESLEFTSRIETFLYNGERYVVTTNFYNIGTEEEYTIKTVECPSEIVTCDSRDNYLLRNGEKIYFSVQEVGTPRASVTHGLTIASGWTLIGSQDFETKIYEACVSLTIGIVTAALGGWQIGMASAVFGFLKDLGYVGNSVSVYFREYTYGYNNQISQFAYVREALGPNKEHISAGKYNPTVYPF